MSSKPESWINDWTDRERGAFLRGLNAAGSSDVADALSELRAENKRLREILGGMADLPTWAEEMGELERERDELRAEVERQQHSIDNIAQANAELSTEVERLRAVFGKRQRAD